MIRRRIYAHWLDPDYLGKHIFSPDLRKRRRDQFEGFLKMHALLGDCVCISDVQLIESSLLLLMFADPNFRTFIAAHPDFVRLDATPSDRFGATWDRLKIVCSGLARIVGHGDNYIPNTFESAETMKHVAGMFENTRSQSDAEQLLGNRGALREFVNGYVGIDQPLVEGLYHALRHFLFDEGVSVFARSSASVPYYGELERAYENTPEEQRTLRSLLTDTLALATTEAERYKRSLILAKLPHVATAGHPDLKKYLTIMQAWNVAVGRTIGADQESAYVFREVYPIPIQVHRGNVPNCTTLVSGQEGEHEPVAEYDWVPAKLTWDLLAKIRTKCRWEIDLFQDSLTGTRTDLPNCKADTIGVNFKALTDAAGQTVAEERAALPPLPSLASACTAASFVCGLVATVLFGSPIPAALGSTPSGLAHSYTTLRRALVSRDASAIAEALYLFGVQYNIARPPSPLR